MTHHTPFPLPHCSPNRRHCLLSCRIRRPPPRPQVALDLRHHPPHGAAPPCLQPPSIIDPAGHRSSIAVQPTPSVKVMSHLSGGVIHLDKESDAGVEEVGSDVEEVVTRVGSRKVSMGFLRERDFSRDQPCETRLLVRQSLTWSRGKSLRRSSELGEFWERGTFCTLHVYCTY